MSYLLDILWVLSGDYLCGRRRREIKADSYLKLQDVCAGSAAETFLRGWHKYEQGHSSERDNESIILLANDGSLECRNETSPTFITNRMAGMWRNRNCSCAMLLNWECVSV